MKKNALYSSRSSKLVHSELSHASPGSMSNLKYKMVISNVKLPAHWAGLPGHAVASRMRANEISFFIVPIDPAYKAGLAGHLPVNGLLPNTP
jgi:hypothetical protein